MSETPRNIALVIGVNGGPETGLAPLRYAEETARQVARTLTAPASDFTLHGGGPLLGEAATSDAVRKAIFDARRDAGSNGLLLIYYIGHGRYITGKSDNSDVFLVTHNFRPDDARDDATAHRSMEWLQEKVLRHDEPNRLLVVLDCCFAGAVGDAAPDPLVANLRRRLEEALNIQSTAAGATGAAMRKALAAVSPHQKAYEANGATCYSAALLRGLTGVAISEDGRVTWRSLQDYIESQLDEAQPGDYGFDRAGGATLAYYPDRAHLRTPNHQPWVMPYPQIPGFVGREEELERLAVTLTGEVATSAALLPAVAGIGGIGKTRLAIEFVYHCRNHFPAGVFWLSMENADTIEAQVAACGGQRGLQLFDDEQSEQLSGGFDDGNGGFERAPRLSLRQQAEQVRAIWETPGRRLLIFDNLEAPKLLDDWRPRGGGCRILITTRRQQWAAGSGVRAFPLASLIDDASYELLLSPRATERGCLVAHLLADAPEAEAALGIVRELGGHPLALTLTGGYLAQSKITLTRYLAQLQAESISHQSLHAALAEGLPQGQRASIAAAFALSYKRLEASDVDTLARAIWLAAAQLAPEPIDAEVLLRVGDLDPTDEVQSDLGERALRRLRELGLIEHTDKAYKLHRLLGAYARSVSEDQPGDQRRVARGLAQTIQRLDDEGELSAPPFREHIRHLLDSKAAGHDVEGASLLHAAGLVLYKAEDYPTARDYYEKALKIFEAVQDDARHCETGITLHALGNVAYREGDYSTARDCYEKALAIFTAVQGADCHRETGITLHALGNVAYREGDYRKARGRYKEALAIFEAVQGADCHRETGITLHELGNVAQAEGDYSRARHHYEEARAIFKAVQGRHRREMATTLHELGNVAYSEGDYPKARNWYEKALAIKEAVLGRRHRETANTLHALGNVAQNEGDYPKARNWYEKARRCYEEALAIKNAVPGRHRETAIILHELGNVAQAEDDYPTARCYYEKALAIKNKVLGPCSHETGITLHELGNVAYREGDYSTARDCYEKALAIFTAVQGADCHRETGITLHELGNVAYREGDYRKARRFYKGALAIFEAVLDRRHRKTAITLHALGNVAQAEGDYPTARRCYKEARAIFEAVPDRRHRERAITIASRRNLFLGVLLETGACAFFTWLWLPQQFELAGACLILGLGVVGYRWWRPATWVVQATWRTQIGSVLPLILLIQIEHFLGSISPPTFILIAVLGGITGLFWPWMMARPPIRTARSRMRQQWHFVTVRLQNVRRRKQTPSLAQEKPNG